MNDEAELELLLDQVDDALDADDLSTARERLARAAELAGPEDPEVLLAEAHVVGFEQGPAAAAEVLARVVAVDPAHAEAHYELAGCAEELGLHALAVEHNLHVLRLDAREARHSRLANSERLDFIEQVATRVLRELPDPFARRLEHVPVVLEARPSRDLVQDGFDPRALGLFEGPTDAGEPTVFGVDSGSTRPTRIVLYTHNLLADFPDRDELAREIEITVLHEVGHFFGLDEDDMERLGLE